MATDSHATWRQVADFAEARQRFATPAHDRYDLIIVGAGSAGLPAASLAAALGARVALLEGDRFGGECLYTGCVPSKALLHASRLAHRIRAAAVCGLTARLDTVDLGAVADYVRRVIGEVYALSDAPEHSLRQGVEVVIGEARFVGPGTVHINGHHISARRFLIATGSCPATPPVSGLAAAGYLTNESVFDLRHLPETLAVVGGGPVGSELAQAFARLGARVVLLQRRHQLLPRDEPEAAELLRKRLETEGVRVLLRAEVRDVVLRGGKKVVTATTPEGPVEVATDELLIATGRAPNVASLDLVAAGVTCDAHHGIVVDAYLRTSNPRVYAAGDVIGSYLFTHAAARQARIAVRNMLYPRFVWARLNEHVMPWATFTEPEVARVGLTEAEARQHYGDSLRVYSQPMCEVDRAVVEGEAVGFVKLISTPKGKLLGATAVGPAASEYSNELALALQQKVSLHKIGQTIHIYPTMALAVQQAAAQFSLDHARRSRIYQLLRRLAR